MHGSILDMYLVPGSDVGRWELLDMSKIRGAYVLVERAVIDEEVEVKAYNLV